jgi:hypothetical protein
LPIAMELKSRVPLTHRMPRAQVFAKQIVSQPANECNGPRPTTADRDTR